MSAALELLRRLDADATEGPWRVGRYPWTVEADTYDLGPRGQDAGNRVATSEPTEIRAHRSPGNARLIATMRTLLPELIELLKVQPVCLCDRFDDQHDVDCPAAETLNALAALDAKAATMETEA